MATGDIVPVVIGADGWYADVTIAGLSTGGMYALGLGTNNNPATGTPKIALMVTSPGFDDFGAPTTIVRTVYGTKQVRQPYPNAALNQESVAGGNVTVRVALSDFVYIKDKAGVGNSGVDIVATILPGFYTQGGVPNNAATVTVTNNSTLAYPKVVANWSFPGGSKITGATFTLRVAAFHASAQQARPVRLVRFTATDAHSNTTTTDVTSMSVDPTVGDAMPVCEYVATMSAASLTALDTVTCNFQAFPWIGDSASILDTTVGGTAQPTPLYGPITRFNDKSGTYGASYAVVDPVSGNDGTGAASLTFSAGAPPAAFATIAAAYNAVRTLNNATYSRNDCGGSTIYLRSGSHAFMGGTPTIGGTPATWATITRFPGDTGVNITSASGGKSAGLMLKLTDIDTFSAQAASGTISAGAGSMLWLDRIGSIDCPTASQPPFYINTVWYVTRCTITTLNQGLTAYAVVNAAPAIVRGNTILSLTGVLMSYTVLGNRRVSTTSGGGLTDAVAGQTMPTAVNTIIAYNWLGVGLVGTPILALAMGSKTYTHGIAVVQNVFENTASTTSALFQIAADSSTGDPVNNVLIWNNVLVGARNNIGYNEVDTASGGGLARRWGWSVKNNLFDEPNIKSDTFAGSGFVADGAKVGNWPLLYGVGCAGNIHGEFSGVATGAAGAFCWEMPGIRCDQPAINGSQPPGCTARAMTYPGFVSRQSYNSGAGAGGGDYHVSTGSPAIGLPHRVLPFDLAGAYRPFGVDAAGAYASFNAGAAVPTNPHDVQVIDGFDPRTYDFARATALDGTIARPTGTGLRYVLSTGVGNFPDLVSKRIREDQFSYVDVFNPGGAIMMHDSIIETPIKYNDTNAAGQKFDMRRCRLAPSVIAQKRTGAITGALIGVGDIQNTEILASVDCFEGGTRYALPLFRTNFSYCWLHGRGFTLFDGSRYGGGAPGTPSATTGYYPSPQEVQAARAYVPGMTVAVGDLIIANTNGTNLYEVTQAGVLGADSPNPPTTGGSAWPYLTNQRYVDLSSGDTSQPFLAGTARMIFVGFGFHSDGVQFTQSGHATFYRCRVEGLGNSAVIIQSAQASVDRALVPVQDVIVRECIMRAGPPGGFFWAYVNCTGKDTNYVANIFAGGLIVSSGTWIVNPGAATSRPWGVQFYDSWLETSDGGTVPSILNAVSTGSYVWDTAMFVQTAAAWKAAVARQFSLDVTADAATLTAMLAGTYDWGSDQLGNGALAINQSVMNARLANNIYGGACDARTFVVWSNNRRRSDGAQLHPSHLVSQPSRVPGQISGLDSNGYYTGT